VIVRLSAHQADDFRISLLDRFANPTRLSASEGFLLFLLMQSSVFTATEFASTFQRFFDRDYRRPSSWLWLYPHFYTTIAECLPEIAGECVRQYVDVHRHTFADPVLKRFAKQFDDFRARGPPAPGGIWDAVRTDDVDALVAFQDAQGFHSEQTMPPSIFTLDTILQNSPNLVHVAAYHGSVRCLARLMVTESALVRAADSAGVTAAGFAVAGGKMDTLMTVEHACKLGAAPQIAVLYHRHEALRYIAKKGGPTFFRALVEPFGSIVHQCAASDNIRALEFCIENDADINIRDSRTVCFFVIGLHFTSRSWPGT
jgi:hypothetical protein